MISSRFSASFQLWALVALATAFQPAQRAAADAITDWNEFGVAATKGFNGTTGTGVTLNSNAATRILAIQGRAVYDAVNAVSHFSPTSYGYAGQHSGSSAAAAAQAAHDVLLSQLPDPAADSTADARWAQTRSWLDLKLVESLTALGVSSSDGGVVAGKGAAVAAVLARSIDNSRPATTYGAGLGPSSNPGIGLWRQSNAAAAFVDPATGSPTGFDATGTVIQARPAIDLHWRDVTPFSLSIQQKLQLIAWVPLPLEVDSPEYDAELEYLRAHGADSAHPGERTADQLAQALYYKQDAEIFVYEAARIASVARDLSLHDNAALFALLGNALVDARIAAWESKYAQKFWRPITALNADADGTATNGYASWHPLAATPSHPSNTSGHSATVAAGAEVLRAFLRSDRIKPNGGAVTLGTLPWLVGTNSGTGLTTTRSVATFSDVQLENGASRLYLGVHFGYDNLQGQLLGLSVADAILTSPREPAARGVHLRDSHASVLKLRRTLQARPDLYGFFGRSTQVE